MPEPGNNGELPPIPPKRYFTIGEVGGLCSLKPHVLRYWEQEFPQLNPVKRRGNRRYYQRQDVIIIRQIKSLLYEQGYTIGGARQKMNNSPKEVQAAQDALDMKEAERAEDTRAAERAEETNTPTQASETRETRETRETQAAQATVEAKSGREETAYNEGREERVGKGEQEAGKTRVDPSEIKSMIREIEDIIDKL